MTTPGGIVFDKDIFSGVKNNVTPAFANNLIDRLGLGGRDGLAFDGCFEFTACELFVEAKNSLWGEGSFENVFGYFSFWGIN